VAADQRKLAAAKAVVAFRTAEGGSGARAFALGTELPAGVLVHHLGTHFGVHKDLNVERNASGIQYGAPRASSPTLEDEQEGNG
jgi:hypothetical protein